MDLKNTKQIHSVVLRLDKDIPRERALRKFLEEKVSEGINRKETILRLYEAHIGYDPFKNTNENTKKSVEVNEEKAEEIDRYEVAMPTMKINKNVTDVSLFED